MGVKSILYTALAALIVVPASVAHAMDAGGMEDGFLRGAGLLVEGAVISGSESGFTGLHRKTLDLHVFRAGRIDGTFLVTEDTLTTDRYSTRFYPYRIKYVMDYFYLSWRFSGSTLGLLMDHICYNVLDMPGDTDPEQLRWYGIGFKWESIGMKTGMKNFGITAGAPGSFLAPERLHYSLYAGASLHTERFKYHSILRGSLRYDSIPLGMAVPYVEGTLQALADDRWRFDGGGEFGARFRAERVDIIPYVNYSYRHDALVYRGRSDGSWMFGLRMESLLGDSARPYGPGAPAVAVDFPELHFSGGYGRYLSGGALGFLTELGASADFVRYRGVTLYLSSDLAHDSKAEGNALYPRYVRYGFLCGVDAALWPGLYAGASAEHLRRHDGNTYRGYTETYNLAGITLFSPGMRLGNANYASGTGTSHRFLNTLEWRIYAGRVFGAHHWPRDWEAAAKVRWDIARVFRTVPYFSPDIRIQRGESGEREYGVETGVRFGTGIALSLYHRWERAADIDAAGGNSVRHHLIGFRVER